MAKFFTLLLLVSWDLYGVSLRMTDKSENNKIFKLSFRSNRAIGLKMGDPLLFTINKNGQYCEALVKNVNADFLTIFVEEIKNCWKVGMALRRGTVFKFDEEKIESREIEANLTKQELSLKKNDFLNQMNDVNIYLYNFELRRKKLDAEYNMKIRSLKLEKIKAMEALYEERKTKSELQLKLKGQIQRLNHANQYYQ